MERKNIKSECDFIGFKNNRLIDQISNRLQVQRMWKKCSNLMNGLSKMFLNAYQFCNGDFNQFVLLLGKGVYPYKYMDSWKRFDETSLPDKEAFYSKLNEESITDKSHAQKVWEELKIKNLGEYHDLYVQCDTLLLADVFENVRDMCIEISELDPAYFLSAPGLA